MGEEIEAAMEGRDKEEKGRRGINVGFVEMVKGLQLKDVGLKGVSEMEVRDD